MHLYPIVREALLEAQPYTFPSRLKDAVTEGHFEGFLNLWIQKRVVHDPIEAMAEALWKCGLRLERDAFFSYPWTWQSVERKERYRKAVEKYFIPLWSDYEIDYDMRNPKSDKMYKPRKKKTE